MLDPNVIRILTAIKTLRKIREAHEQYTSGKIRDVDAVALEIMKTAKLPINDNVKKIIASMVKGESIDIAGLLKELGFKEEETKDIIEYAQAIAEFLK